MKGERFGEVVTIVGVIVVALSLIGVLGDVEFSLEARYIAWGGVALILVGEAILVKG